MKNFIRALAVIATASLAVVTSAECHEAKAGDLLVTDLWTRATPGGAKVAGGYITITNNGSSADKLVSATSSEATKVEVHEMSMSNGVMTMRPLDGGLAIEPGKSVTLAPGGLHLMFMDIKQPLKEGEKLPVTLQFEKAGKVETFLHVQSVGAKGMDASSMNGMKEHKH